MTARDFTAQAQRAHHQILAAIHHWRLAHDCGPSTRDLLRETDVTSTSMVAMYLEQLRDLGLVVWSERYYDERGGCERVRGSLNLTALGRREVGR